MFACGRPLEAAHTTMDVAARGLKFRVRRATTHAHSRDPLARKGRDVQGAGAANSWSDIDDPPGTRI
jgi:hypothetical protein